MSIYFILNQLVGLFVFRFFDPIFRLLRELFRRFAHEVNGEYLTRRLTGVQKGIRGAERGELGAIISVTTVVSVVFLKPFIDGLAFFRAQGGEVMGKQTQQQGFVHAILLGQAAKLIDGRGAQ